MKIIRKLTNVNIYLHCRSHEPPVTERKSYIMDMIIKWLVLRGCFVANHQGIEEILRKVQKGFIPLRATMDPQLSAPLKPLWHVHIEHMDKQLNSPLCVFGCN